MNNDCFRACANEHRRRLLAALLDTHAQDGAVHVSKTVQTDEGGLDRLQVELYHIHLPKLIEYGYIQWDEENHEIRTGPQFEEVRPLVEFVNDHAEN